MDPENFYREDVFLSELRHILDRKKSKIWNAHQQMQLSFLQLRGVKSNTNFLDLGCGPMRLGSVLIPKLVSGWYYGQDINSDTIKFGYDVLNECGIDNNINYTLFSSEFFNLSAVDRLIDIAFSNSLFSHLSINSIYTCLLQLRHVLKPAGVYYATFFDIPVTHSWLDPFARNKWGNKFYTYPNQDPYHYHFSLLEAVAKQAGYCVDLLNDYNHPTQTMACFRLQKTLEIEQLLAN